jgi:hypothetical protein
MSRPPILFLNCGWMKRYAGEHPDDPTRGSGFSWLRESASGGHGHESYNFYPYRGRCYGYHPSNKRTNIERLGAARGADRLDGILVIWFSRDPRTNKAFIVGWHRNATVYRDFQKHKPGKTHPIDGIVVTYKTVADAADCHVIPENERTFHIPSKNDEPGGYGQSTNWYGLDDAFLDKVWAYVGRGRYPGAKRGSSKPPRNQDPEIRLKVEKAAIAAATKFYQSVAGGGRTVKSVELDKVGWDLEATGPNDTLLIEVKGLSGSQPIAELTPNEYAHMKKVNKHGGLWVLFVVTDCLTKKPKSHEFRYRFDSKRWESEAGFALEIVEHVAAVVWGEQV